MTSRPGLPLPLKLIVEIFKHCEEYGWPEGVDAEYAGVADPTSYNPVYPEGLTWITATNASKANICNIRVVCKTVSRCGLRELWEDA